MSSRGIEVLLAYISVRLEEKHERGLALCNLKFHAHAITRQTIINHQILLEQSV